MLSNFFKELIKPHKDLSSKIDSEQFKLSREILRNKHKLNFSQEEMADILQLSLDEYIDVEFGEEDIPVEKYLKLLKELESIDSNNKPKVIFNGIYQSNKVTEIKEQLNNHKAHESILDYNIVKGKGISIHTLTIDFSPYVSQKENCQLSSKNVIFNVTKSDVDKKRDGEAA